MIRTAPLAVGFAWAILAPASLAPAQPAAAPALERLAADVRVIEAEVEALRRSLDETLASLRAGEAKVEPPDRPEPADDLRDLAERLERLTDEQSRISDRIDELTRADADTPAESKRSDADAAVAERTETRDHRRVDARYTRYTNGYSSGVYYVRAEPRRTVARSVAVDRGHHAGYAGYGYASGLHRRAYVVSDHGLVHRRYGYPGHVYRSSSHYRPYGYGRHAARHYRRHSGLVIGSRGGDFFFKLRLGGAVHYSR